jgi:riboflavin kinase / FMN adenylyltransferase
VTTHFTSKQVTGKGRGKFLGYPTINMEVPADFELSDGIYAVWVTLSGTRFRGALHWGPVPVFDEEKKSLEVFILGVSDRELSHANFSLIAIEIVKKLRDVANFPSVDALTEQMRKDIVEVRKTLRE